MIKIKVLVISFKGYNAKKRVLIIRLNILLYLIIFIISLNVSLDTERILDKEISY